jgi:hypothetical protein
MRSSANVNGWTLIINRQMRVTDRFEISAIRFVFGWEGLRVQPLKKIAVATSSCFKMSDEEEIISEEVEEVEEEEQESTDLSNR